MRWECCECGARLERPRRPRVCRECGTASLFVEADENEPRSDELFDAWMQSPKRSRGAAFTAR